MQEETNMIGSYGPCWCLDGGECLLDAITYNCTSGTPMQLTEHFSLIRTTPILSYFPQE
jgi:hypothetical protein